MGDRSPQQGRKVLFLDFDGVLHVESRARETPFNRLPLLNEVASRYQFEVVISSSWRFTWTLKDLQKSLGPELRVIGATGPAFIGKHPRANEILLYAQENRLTDWRALDDARFEFPPGFKNLVWCNPREGLTAKEIQLLETWLQTPSI